jgi:hypothetical protein
MLVVRGLVIKPWFPPSTVGSTDCAAISAKTEVFPANQVWDINNFIPVAFERGQVSPTALDHLFSVELRFLLIGVAGTVFPDQLLNSEGN